MMKHILMGATLALAGMTATVSASDLPIKRYSSIGAMYVNPAPVYSWNGLYVGLNGGIVGATGAKSGAVLGGQVGWNFQSDALVLGARTDFGYSGIRGSGTICGGGLCATETGRSPLFGSTVALVGYSPASASQWLLYGTAGVAYTQVKYDLVLSGLVNTSGSSQMWKTGPYAGLGVAYALNSNMSVAVEVGRAWFNGDTTTFTMPGATAIVENGRRDVTVGRLSFNFRFN